MIKAVIVEDEPKSNEMLKSLLNKYCPDVNVVASADSYEEAIKVITENKPELVFLDIELSGKTGFDLLQFLPDKNFEVIFTTAYDKYAIRAIKFSALDYLLKPIDPEELTAAVEKIKEKGSDQKTFQNIQLLMENLKKPEKEFTKITLPTGNAYEIINIKDIIRCESEGHYTNFILSNNKKLLVSISLKHYEDILPSDVFIRIHHSHLININHVVRVLKADGGYAVMSDNSQVEISRRKKDAFLQRLQNI